MRVPAFLLPILLAAPAVFGQAAPEPPGANERQAREIRALIRKLESPDFAVRKDAERKLIEIGAPALVGIHEAWDRSSPSARGHMFNVLMAPARKMQFSGGVEIVIGPGAPGVSSESMQGSSIDPESGDRIHYTLHSAGTGEYTLEAKWTDAKGNEIKRIKDRGTLAGLQKKHPFLKGLKFLGQWSPQPERPEGGRRFESSGFVRIPVRPQGVALGRFGVRLQRPSKELAFHLELPERAGFVVAEVLEGSPADRAGIRRYDVIVRLNGEILDDLDALDRTGEQLARKPMVLDLVRRAKPKRLNVTEALRGRG